MESCDVLIVGGGPAGAACAGRLRELGAECLVLDAVPFPRLKLCAGWITPEVLALLGLRPEDYPHGLLRFERLRIHLRSIGFPMAGPQYSIRRTEFDHWLLGRSGARVVEHNVRTVRADGDGYTVDDAFHARYIVGAGGTRCPVYRALFREANPRARELQAVALEQEFRYHWTDPDCHLWFFDHGFPGYSWYVPKAQGWLNVGIGGMASQLKARDDDIKTHWARLTARLEREGLVRGQVLEPKGYSYYLRAEVDVPRVGNAFVVGDSAGLATRDLCEGIGPALHSGRRAAEAIALGRPYELSDLSPHTADRPLVHAPLEYLLVARERRRLQRAGA